MAWGKDGGNQGPWGRPPTGNGGSGGPGGGNKRPQPPQGPDLDRIFREGQERFRKILGNGGGPGSPDDRKRLFLAGTAIAAIILVFHMTYFVGPDEQGVVMRFGEYHRSTEPGMHFHLPYPVETVTTPKVTSVNRIEVGSRSGGRIGASSIPEESLMLTGDENIIDINFEVQWKISNAEDYLFNVRNQEETVKAVAESSMREVIGKAQIATVLAEGKLIVEQSAKKLMQDTLNSYRAGVEIVSVNLLKADPPTQVIDAFRDMQTAKADLETARNEAEAYRNDIIPRARGDAQKLILDADAYRQQVVAKASGEAERFRAVYSEYKQSKDVTRKRLYIETMEEIMQGTHKIITDRQGAGIVPYLPLKELKPASGKEERAQ